jgi:malonyl-CoA/methylmalonyl-CoA synthetase
MGSETLIDCFAESFMVHGEKTAVTSLRNGEVETVLSYRELDKDSNRMARWVGDQGLGKGDRGLLLFPKSLIFTVTHLALQKIGAISVPLNPGFKKAEMSYFLHDAEPKVVFCGPDQENLIREIAPSVNPRVIPTEKAYHAVDFFRSAPDDRPPTHIRPDDPGIIIYTSGTTGKPKGAILTHKNLAHDARNIISIWEITSSDVLCHALPLFHVHGLCFALHTCLMAGAHILMLDAFTPKTVLDALSENQEDKACTLFMAVPSMYARLMDEAGEGKLPFEHMRLWTSGSAPLLPKDFERITKTFGKEPVEREGMSETGMNFSNPVRGVRKAGSIGIPLPGLQVRIVDVKTFQDVARGETGEIWLKGPAVTPGYWRNPEETASTFTDGWFRTGDLGMVDQDGYYYLTDRIKHIIISGGENISPKEVEAVINRMDGVLESSVVGIPDEKWGERVVTAVVAKKGSTLQPSEVQSFCKKHLHDWKCPKSVVLVDELPKNTMGKVLKENVKKLFHR